MIEFNTQIKWLKFATDHEMLVHKEPNDSFQVLNEVFVNTKFHLGTKKDFLLAELKFDIDAVKREVKEKYKDFLPEKGYSFSPHERIEYEITNFCEKYSDVDLIKFVSDRSWIESITRLNNTYNILHRYYLDKQDELGVKAIVFTYLPMTISLTTATIWLLLHLLPVLKF